MSNRTGFTLVEILLVLAILVAITSSGILVLRGTLVQQQLNLSANRLRGEWLDARVLAMEEGQIFCMRCKLGGSMLVIERVLDAHFTAGLSSRQTTRRYDVFQELDPFEKGGFVGEVQDFILRDPDSVSAGGTAILVELPKTVIFADVIAVAEERSAFYLGLTVPGEATVEENVSEIEAVTLGEMRLGETSSSDGLVWSSPIFFYPDGTTSTAAVLLKNEAGRCCEVRLRGLTAKTTLTGITTQESYVGELDASRF
jgi:prepilin-type N-terminal cleavage/methylation domain-containing protein